MKSLRLFHSSAIGISSIKVKAMVIEIEDKGKLAISPLPNGDCGRDGDTTACFQPPWRGSLEKPEELSSSTILSASDKPQHLAPLAIKSASVHSSMNVTTTYQFPLLASRPHHKWQRTTGKQPNLISSSSLLWNETNVAILRLRKSSTLCHGRRWCETANIRVRLSD